MRRATWSPRDCIHTTGRTIPTHICPTSTLHSHAWVAVGGRIRGRWEITARDRSLTL